MTTKDQLFSENESLKKRIEELENALFQKNHNVNSLLKNSNRKKGKRKIAELEPEILYQALQAAQQMTKVGYWRYNVKTQQPWWSDMMFEVLGVEKGRGVPVYEEHKNIWHPDDWKLFNNAVNECITGKPYNITVRVLSNKDKTYHLINTQGFPVKNEKGQITELLGTSQDITELKKNEILLKRSEEKFKSVFEDSDLAMAIVEKEGKFSHVNNAACRFFEYSKEKLLNINYLDVTHPDYKEISVKKFQHSLKNKTPYRLEKKYITGKERIKWGVLTFTPVFDTKGNQIYSLAQLLDITEKKQAEELLAENEEKLRGYFHTNPSAIFVWKKIEDDFFLNDVNEAAQIITNSIAFNFLGIRASSLYHNHPLMIEKLNECWKSKKVIDFEHYFKNSTLGVHDWFEFRLAFAEPDIVLLYSNIITERKKAEKKILDSQFYLSKAQELGKIGTWELDLQNNNLIWTEETYKIFGLSPGTRIDYETFLNLVHPDDRSYLDKEWSSKMMTNNYEIEHRIIVDDKVKWLREKAEVKFNKKGKPIKAVGFVQDISERKIATLTLKNSEENFREMFRNMSNGVCRYKVVNAGSDFIFEDINQAGEKIAKLKKSDVIGKSLLKIRPNTGEYGLIDVFKRVWETGKSEVYNDSFYQDEELTGYYKNFVYKLNSGDIVAIFEDLTKEKQAESELIEAKERAEESNKKLADSLYDLSLAQEIANIGNWQFDPTIGIPFWSKEIYNIYERDPNKKPPNIREYKQIYDPEQYEIFFKAFQSALKDGKDYDIVLKLNLPSGKIKWVRAICKPDVNNKTPKGYILRGTIQDISERRNNEIALSNALMQAKEANRLKSLFLAIMSHEIRTPMNGILGFASLLRDPGISKKNLNKYIELIEKSGGRMLNVINDVIDISRIEVGQVKIVKSIFKVNEQLEYLHAFFQPETENKNIELILHLTKRQTDKEIFTDKEKWIAILMNLIKNAIKYTEKGTIEFGYNLLPGKFEFYVKDTGIGIKKNRQIDIFDGFVQEDFTITKPNEGIGLGLAISKRFADLLGGDIRVESQKGKGSKFYFTIEDKIPVKMESNKKEDLKMENQDLVPMKDLTVLIAEDDKVAKVYFREILKNVTKSMIFVESGTECVEQVRKNPGIDLVLMDIKLLELDGYLATKKIREFNKKVKIIAQTAYALSGDREKAIEAGCDEYITKPIDKKQLFEMIRTICAV